VTSQPTPNALTVENCSAYPVTRASITTHANTEPPTIASSASTPQLYGKRCNAGESNANTARAVKSTGS